MMLRIANVLSEEQVVSMRASLSSETAPWVDGRVTAGYSNWTAPSNI